MEVVGGGGGGEEVSSREIIQHPGGSDTDPLHDVRPLGSSASI